jgi:hypothetical protein
MKIEVKTPERVVWSAETRRVVLLVDGREVMIDYAEDDNHAQAYISVDGSNIVEWQDYPDTELIQQLEDIELLFRTGVFSTAGTEIDLPKELEPHRA